MFQITLKAAREMCGFTPEEVAKYCGITIDELNEAEEDSGKIPFNITVKFIKLFGDFIYFGSKSDCIKHNRRHIIQNIA